MIPSTAGEFLMVSCNEIIHGCRAYLILDLPSGAVVPPGGQVPDDERVAGALEAKGWRRSFGKWICGAHDPLFPRPDLSWRDIALPR